MSIFNRISDVINSNLNAMLDRAEDPGKMIKQITRELEQVLADVRTQSARQIAERHRLQARIRRLDAESRSRERRAELAIERGRDDLARSALRERTRINEVIREYEAEVQTIDDTVNKLKSDRIALEEKRNCVRARQHALIIRSEIARSRLQVKRRLNDSSWESALARFEGRERRLDQMEGIIESCEPGNRTLAAELKALEEEHRLDTELAALRERAQSRQAATR